MTAAMTAPAAPTPASTASGKTADKADKAAAQERSDFLAVFDALLADVLAGAARHRLPENGREWIRTMLLETVPGGKMNRGLTVPSAYASILHRPLSKDELFQAQILGWCIELLQAFFLISDDIMDGSITRRGQPCWYKRDRVGMIAINDAFIVESVIYQLIRKYFRSSPAYVHILELFHEVTYQTELGQLMDLITAPEGDVDLSRFSIDKHAYIVEYKTAYYSFYLPIALAMRLAGIESDDAYAQARAVLIPLGEYFQVQDDYLDCYGSPEVIGKIGTDIEDNKCGWLIVQALSRASADQRAVLDANYGRKDPECVAAVKAVYRDLDIESVYHAYEEDSYNRITALIEQVDDSLLPRNMFVTFMNRIYKRNA